MLSMQDLNLNNKRVFIREDLNVPMQDGKITNDARIQRALPTIKQALKANAAVMILSHLGRPQEGEYDAQYSLQAVADQLSILLNQEVKCIKNWLDGMLVKPGQVVLCENVRFQKGEKANDIVLAKKIAALCDVFVMDAFATAHRAQASTVGVAEYAPIAVAGPLLLQEIQALKKVVGQPQHPLMAVVGGSKVSTKIQVLEKLIDQVDQLIVGGGIANTFLAAQGVNIGQSLYEPDWVEPAKILMKTAKAKGVVIPLPVDVTVAKTFSAQAKADHKKLADIAADDLILDVGPKTAATYPAMMQAAKTILWNGPVGVFEFPAFSHGTQALGEAIAHSQAYSVAGGGDTLAALDQFQLADKISYVCTGGGALLEFIEGKLLPAISILQNRARQYESAQ